MIERIIVGPMYTNAYIFQTGQKTCIVIDPGGDADKIIGGLTLKNLTPQGIICTHGHLDHIAALGSLKQHYAEKEIDIPVAIHKKDKQYLGKTAESVHRQSLKELGLQGDGPFNELYSPMPEPDVIIEAGNALFDADLVAMYTPGHTQGSISVYCESQNLLFSGDTLFFEGIGRTDLSDGDGEQLIRSIKEELFTLPPLTRVFPGHGPDTTLEREINHNPFVN